MFINLNGLFFSTRHTFAFFAPQAVPPDARSEFRANLRGEEKALAAEASALAEEANRDTGENRNHA
jgi:hypothetical protein